MLPIAIILAASPNATWTPRLPESLLTSPNFTTSQSVSAQNSLVRLSMGQSYQFLVSANSPYGATGTWNAEYGTITATGLYTPSTYLTDAGVDIVTYSGNAGISAQIAIKVVVPDGFSPSQPIVLPTNFLAFANLIDKAPTPWTPNPKLGPSEIDEPFGFGSLTGGQIDALVPGWIQNLSVTDAIPSDGKAHAATLQGAIPGPVQVGNMVNCYTPVAETVNGQLAYPVPTNETLPTGIFISAATLPDGLRVCEMGQVYPKNIPSGPSYVEGEMRRVAGRKMLWVKKLPPFQLGAITITAEIRAGILKHFPNENIKLGDVVQVSGNPIDYTENYTFDQYEYKNSAWVYKGPGQCVRSGLGLKTNPVWAATMFGDALDGGPGAWTPWACAHIGK